MEELLRFSGKTAVVTGGARGIGRAISVRLARDGADVIATYTSRPDAAEELVQEAEQRRDSIRAVRCDVADRADIRALFAGIRDSFSRLDILVNNAGVFLPNRIGESDEDELDQLWAVNVRGLFYCIEEAAPLFTNGGRIINLSSVAGRAAQLAGFSMYGATKAAVDALTRRLAAELAPQGVTVNAVAPGFVRTDMGRDLERQVQLRPDFASKIPLGRLGQPEDIADVVAFLASDDSRFMTGQSLNISGGQVW